MSENTVKLNAIVVKATQSGENDKLLTLLSPEEGKLTVIAEYFIIATATSSTHVRALADIVEEKLTEAGFEPDHIEGKATGWILLDYNGVVIHIFTRETYNCAVSKTISFKTTLFAFCDYYIPSTLN